MTITEQRLEELDTFFRAANYLGAAQIYLRDNVLLRRELKPADIKPRLLGHWGTQPGLNLVYAHLSRLVQDTDIEAMLMVGPGHGAPAILGCLWLEGTLGEVYPSYARNAAGLEAFVRAFSWPGGLPSHLTALTPGTIHEGGELGYALLHAFGAVFDNPDLMVACVVGDGEAETGALAASWHSPKLVDLRRDGMVLPILHLNGHKLSGPTLLARMSDEELGALFKGYGYVMRVVDGYEPRQLHRDLAAALDWAHATMGELRVAARGHGALHYRGWPMIVLRTPKGLTGPKMLGRTVIEGTFHSHQVPIPDPRGNPDHLQALEAWLRSYRSEELFKPNGQPVPTVTSNLPRAKRLLGRCRHANGGSLKRPLELPDQTRHAVQVIAPGAEKRENTAVLGRYLRDVFDANQAARNFRLFCPDETSSNKLGAVFEVTSRAFALPLAHTDEGLGADGRVMEILSEQCCQGWLEGYLLSGRHGVFACYEAFIGIVDSMMAQYAKWQKMAAEIPWRRPTASLNYLLTSHVWEQDHNGYSHQGPTFINTLLTRKSAQTRIYLPPDANCLLSVAAHCLRSENYINLIIASKKPQHQWLDLDAADAHCARGASIWSWAGHGDDEPDIVLAAAGDVPTRETLAAAALLRRILPDLRTRVVNVVDLMTLELKGDHPHGLDRDGFIELFGVSTPVIFAFHGYPLLIHELIYRHPYPDRFHVHGYIEEGTTTTPFDMLVLNRMSRFDLAIAALRRAPRLRAAAGDVVEKLQTKLAEHRAYIHEHGEDMPEVLSWEWAG